MNTTLYLIFTTLALAVISVAASAADPPSTKQTGYAPVNGLKMYYEIIGEGRPAVFIPPFMSQSGLVPQLTLNRRWISMDLQGHGRTADTDRPLTCEQEADDIAALLKYLKIAEADVFGDSFGGTIAIVLAVRHPELVRKVVSYGSPLLPFPKEVAAGISANAEQMRWEREMYGKSAPEPGHWPVAFAKVLKCGSEWKGFTADELRTIKARVLFACGDHDLIPVERCAELSRLVPNAQLAVIPDASHFVLFSEPGKLLPTIAAFLDAPVPTVPLASFTTGYYPGVTR